MNGERSIARAYLKALRRARALIYLEDQYLWSPDVVEYFARALRASPGLRMLVPEEASQAAERWREPQGRHGSHPVIASSARRRRR